MNQNDMVSLPPQNSNRDHDHSKDTELLATAAELYRNLRQAAGLTLEEAVVQTSGYTVPLEETITACQEVIKSQPDNPHAYFMLGNAQRQQQDIDGAIASYRKALELAPDNYYFYRHLSTLLYQEERLDEAITVCQQALQSQPENPLIYSALGKIQLQKGNQAEGMANCKKAVELAEGVTIPLQALCF
ncbi:tetratricopeptide repeat protein [Moorena sp. SIO4G3]|uniref:tetratricopeptide repeat protein n=1 Tax=Moorena sp. SIO4G3 TaxID=2607821 RepID=UPI00142B0158|nr:tetratricopeptide repeat protein [Moorena sp. SIO4G3]NEO82068.1 tetratricopeptide repeat protein [Moorena sp. SIO4G3]